MIFFGRRMFHPQWLEGDKPLIDEMFKQHYGVTIHYQKGFFSSTTQTYSDSIGEQGILFDDKFVIFLIKEQVKRLLHVNIKRAESYALTKKLKLKFNRGTTKPFDENDWIEVNLGNYEKIIDEQFNNYKLFQFYEKLNEEDVSKTRTELDLNQKNKQKK